jgi:hypothetical protein
MQNAFSYKGVCLISAMRTKGLHFFSNYSLIIAPESAIHGLNACKNILHFQGNKIMQTIQKKSPPGTAVEKQVSTAIRERSSTMF